MHRPVGPGTEHSGALVAGKDFRGRGHPEIRLNVDNTLTPTLLENKQITEASEFAKFCKLGKTDFRTLLMAVVGFRGGTQKFLIQIYFLKN